jgi:2-oxoglutarate dehydrogenase complex dehydrogenase (E1) component-like enzyme
MALDYRNEFHKDIVIDLLCYRRLGHNEADEPAVTQPMMYRKIAARPTARALYAERLAAASVMSREESAALVEDYRRSIEQGVVVARPVLCGLDNAYRVNWSDCQSEDWDQTIDTGAEHNIQVCVPTTPAQMFHLLRRQMVRDYRKPLIVMTPKSLLRHRLAVSGLDELVTGQFRTLIPETEAIDPAGVTRVIFCAGKVYYDLLEARRARGLTHCALIRMLEAQDPPPNE